MPDSQATLSIILKAKNLANAELDKLGGKARSLSSGALAGLGLGMIGVAGAATALTGALIKGVQGAIEEEAGIKRLGTVLAANVKDWNGNTDAIEKSVRARTDLGFTDNDLRDSLSKLVPATKSVTRAFDVQSVAMDLARLKGISVVEASEALVKVEAGQYRMLKSLGIQLKENATQEEALAAVQKVAQGQAQAYMETTAGRIELMGNKWDDLTERVGAHAIPVVVEFTDKLVDLLDVIDETSDMTLDQRLTELTDTFAELNPLALGAGSVIKDYADKAKIAERRTQDLAAAGKYATEKMGIFSGVVGDNIGLSDNAAAKNRELARALGKVTSNAQSGADALAAVNDQIDWMTELDYIKEHSKKSRKRGANARGAGDIGNNAEGGWVGLNGPELSWLGEEGPEYVIPNDQLRGRGGASVRIEGVSARELDRIIDEALYVRLRRAGSVR